MRVKVVFNLARRESLMQRLEANIRQRLHRKANDETHIKSAVSGSKTEATLTLTIANFDRFMVHLSKVCLI